jgi:hypothetical protein
MLLENKIKKSQALTMNGHCRLFISLLLLQSVCLGYGQYVPPPPLPPLPPLPPGPIIIPPAPIVPPVVVPPVILPPSVDTSQLLLVGLLAAALFKKGWLVNEFTYQRIC